MSLHVLNTLTQKKEKFESLIPGQVKMYVCGPTVYDFLHIGNFRGAIFFNLVRNWLERSGYKVDFVYNYTDVDDKIIQRAQKEGAESSEVAERYIAEFQKDFQSLKLKPHTHNPRVTEFMPQILQLVEDLINRNKAYVADGEVLYVVRSFEGYGKLSHKDVDDLESGSRVEVDAKKRDPLDFALWKPAKPGEPKWNSPWSEGRPGWHIECSAMARSILGDSIDIHGGGMDLIFPHHENEIAQSEGASGKPFVKYWMHNNMLTFGDKKMSKSLGNILKAREFLSIYDGEILKFMMLSAHYRSLTDFSEKQIENAVSGLSRVYAALAKADEILSADVQSGQIPAAFAAGLQDQSQKVKAAMDDDFNTPEVFAAIFTLVRSFNSLYKPGQKITGDTVALAKGFRDWVLDLGQLMALFQESAAAYLRQLDDRWLQQKGLAREAIDQLVAARTQARTQKDFARADEIRKQLTEMGIALHDMASGTKWEVL